MAQSGLILAVDGGQSSTLALAATHSGVIVGIGFAGPSNHVKPAAWSGWKARCPSQSARRCKRHANRPIMSPTCVWG
jgi:hypothetical protein